MPVTKYCGLGRDMKCAEVLEDDKGKGKGKVVPVLN
jgi:hypothetical protein